MSPCCGSGLLSYFWILWLWSDRSHADALSLPLSFHKCGFISQPLTLGCWSLLFYVHFPAASACPSVWSGCTPPAGGRQTGMNVSSCWSFLWKIVQTCRNHVYQLTHHPEREQRCTRAGFCTSLRQEHQRDVPVSAEKQTPASSESREFTHE